MWLQSWLGGVQLGLLLVYKKTHVLRARTSAVTSPCRTHYDHLEQCARRYRDWLVSTSVAACCPVGSIYLQGVRTA